MPPACCRNSGRAVHVNSRQVALGFGRAFLGRRLEHREAGRRIVLGAAAADDHRRERAHRCEIAFLGLRSERGCNFRLVDMERCAVAQLARDVHGGRRLALLGGEHDPQRRVLPVHRESVFVEADQILRIGVTGDPALDQVHHGIGDGARDLELAPPAEPVDPLLDRVGPERIDLRLRGRR